MKKSSKRSGRLRCDLCSNREFFQVLNAELTTQQLHREDGRWVRSSLRQLKARATVTLAAFCGSCGRLLPEVPVHFQAEAPREKSRKSRRGERGRP